MIELIKVILTASLSLVSLLVAVISFLLAQYARLKSAPTYEFKPYKNFATLMTAVLCVSGVTCILSFLYLVGVFPQQMLTEVFIFISVLFLSLIVSTIFGVVLILISTLR